jgi:hypothetical protein
MPFGRSPSDTRLPAPSPESTDEADESRDHDHPRHWRAPSERERVELFG